MRRFSGLVVALLVGVAGGWGSASAQYFGQNKVQYRTFRWQVIQTEHFEVYFYDRERDAAMDEALMAERSYARLSRVLRHQFKARKPIIMYASQTDMAQTNTSGGDLGEGTVAFTEPFKHRIVIPSMGGYADNQHVLQHEMVHQFQFDVFSHGQIGGGLQQLSAVAPPLWFMEGMAEYLSIGPVDPLTTMWLRDAALEGRLPTIEQMTFDQRIFPYRYGHALFAYIGEKWGDDVIGEILQASVSSGIEGAFRRALGRSLADLSDEWRDAIQNIFLPQLAEHYRAQRIAKPLLTQRRSEGSLHLAAALSPDGKSIVYLSERNSFFIDLYLADGETGRLKRRLVKSTINSNYESLRFINSTGSFSPDGQYFAIAVKHKDRDDIVIIDVPKDREAGRITVPLNGVTNPVWSPDGKQLAFTGFDGGLSDLFLVNRDGSDLRRLTNDRYADLNPAWSPDGKTIAIATDRGPETDFNVLRFGNIRIALYHLDTGNIELLNHMDVGRNINPVWAPDGRSLAFVSDRSGISNVFLYDFSDKNIYQLTDVYTGVSGITPVSPCLSWARQADRLAFAYFEDGDYDVYTVDNPRSLRREPYRDQVRVPFVSLLSPIDDSMPVHQAVMAGKDSARDTATSVYRSPSGLRSSAATPLASDTSIGPPPVSIRTLMDSANLALPDTTEFAIRTYHTRFSTDFIAQPTIGYQRDSFGRGIFGGTAISLSDMLGDRVLQFGGALNGRLAEAQVLAAYFDLSHRTNWAAQVSQNPIYFYAPSSIGTVGTGTAGQIIFTTRIRRLVVRDGFVSSFHPFNRFNRAEFAFHIVNLSDAILEQQSTFTSAGSFVGNSNLQTVPRASVGYVSPSVALVHDNALFGFTGPFAGGRDRLQISPAVGAWKFVGGLADLRRYLFARPFTLALRGIFYGRVGRDGDEFPIFLGSTELIRGYTANSLINHECYLHISDLAPIGGVTGLGNTGCPDLDQLIGSRIAVVNVEIRFPLTRTLQLGFLPIGLPPIEGAIFYDAGLAWSNGSTLKWRRNPGDDPETVRAPLQSWGGSIRANILGAAILRIDYAVPIDRTYKHGYWTVSVGPTF